MKIGRRRHRERHGCCGRAEIGHNTVSIFSLHTHVIRGGGRKRAKRGGYRRKGTAKGNRRGDA